ncbi:hypothetical protein ACP70R_004343 [Stipagrostis hirtigluma subsp. patula]
MDKSWTNLPRHTDEFISDRRWRPLIATAAGKELLLKQGPSEHPRAQEGTNETCGDDGPDNNICGAWNSFVVGHKEPKASSRLVLGRPYSSKLLQKGPLGSASETAPKSRL